MPNQISEHIADFVVKWSERILVKIDRVQLQMDTLIMRNIALRTEADNYHAKWNQALATIEKRDLEIEELRRKRDAMSSFKS